MLSGLSLNLGILLAPGEGEEHARLAVVQVPARLPRLMRPAGVGPNSYVFLEDVISSELSALFPGQAILEAAAFRVTRDAEMELDDEGGRDYLEAIEDELKKRRRSRVVRLETRAAAGETLVQRLQERLAVAAEDVYRVAGPLDPRALASLVELPALEDLRDPPLKPLAPLDVNEQENLFAILDERDVVLHHPYEALRRGGVARLPGRRRSRRAGHQADALPDQRRIPGRPCAGPRRGPGEAGDGARGAHGPVRRAVEHPLGAEPRGIRGPRHLRDSGIQDPREDLPGGPPGEPGDPSVRAPRHGELQRQDRPPLHGLRPDDHRSRDRQGRLGLLQRPHGIFGSAQDEEAPDGAHLPSGQDPRPHRARDAASRVRPGGRDPGEDELPRGRGHHPRRSTTRREPGSGSASTCGASAASGPGSRD